MQNYTMSDVQEADQRWEEMPLPEVSEKTGIPVGTLWGWAKNGLIDTSKDWFSISRRARSPYDEEVISRADELWDVMPLTRIAEVLDVPVDRLRQWSTNGWINTDVNWSIRAGGNAKAVDPTLVVEAYFESDRSQKEVGEEFGIRQQTVSKYVCQYRNGNL